MIRDLSREAAEHDNAAAVAKREGAETRHQKDKREKRVRLQTEWQPSPGLAREAGAGIIDGVFDAENAGFCCECIDGVVRRVKDDSAYIRRAIAMSKQLAIGTRIRVRNGKELRYNHTYRTGMVSMIMSIPPWQAEVIRRLPLSERELAMVQICQVWCDTIKAVSGRPCYGLSIHFDSALPHAHVHVPRSELGPVVERDGKPVRLPGPCYEKAEFLTIGGATVGWDRINRRFGQQSGLISKLNLQRLKSNLSKKYDQDPPRKLVDVECARASDKWFEEIFIKKNSLQKEYAAELQRYAAKKLKALTVEQSRPLVKAAVARFVADGVWLLAREAMDLAIYRLLPKELRKPVICSIRSLQFVAKPSLRAAIRIAKEMGKEVAQPTMRGASMPHL